MMTHTALKNAIKEAARFLEAARTAQKAVERDYALLSGSKVTAAAKRASMDLTRALAEMRKP